MPVTSNKVDAYARQLASQSAVYISPTGSGLMVSSGTIVKPTIAYNAGGTVTIGSTGTYRFYHTPNYFGEITEHTITGTTLSIPDQITSYIVANYNSGTPQYSVTTDLSTINFSNNVAVYTCSRVGDTNIDFLDWDEPALSLANKLLRRDMECRRFERVTGLSLSEDVGRKVIISAGVVWQGSFRNSLIEVNSSINNCVQVVTDVNGDWVITPVTTYNNSQYDNGNGVSTLTDGNYAVNWIYRGMGIDANSIIIYLGTGDYDLNEAKTAQPPSVALITSTNAMLIGKIIVLKGELTSIQIDSTFMTQFVPSTTTSHDGLTGLQGGNETYHYHSDQLINTDSDVEFLSIIGKATTNDGSTNVFEGKDSNEATVFSVNSDGKVGIGGTPSTVSTTKLNVVGDAVVTENMGIGGLPDSVASLKVTGDTIITGDLQVTGTTTTVNSTDLEVLNNQISLSVVETPLDSLADGGGVVLKGTTDKTILYNDGTKSWDVSENVIIPTGKKLTTENISSDTDITLTATGSIINASDIVPNTTNTRSLGSLLKVFANIFTRKIESDDAILIKSASNKAINITSGSAGAVSISSEGSGAINIATDAHAKTVTIGNNYTTSAVNIISGTGNVNISGTGNVGINTTDLDGTPAVGKLIVKGVTNDGSTNILVGRDSDEVNVFSVDTNGKVTTKDVVANTISTANETNGYVTMNAGGVRTGFFEWKKGDGTRLGFMGDGETDVTLALENGANFVVNGFTKLGNDAPAIKTKKITGTTPSTVLTLGSYPHGLTKSKILGYQMIVESGADNILIPPNNGDHPTDLHYYFTYIDNTNLTIYPGSSATTILGKPFRAIITYEE